MPTIKSLQCPVFLALGRHDYWNSLPLWDSVRPSFKDLTFRIFERSGHTPQFEEAQEFDRELLRWLGK